MRLVSILSGEDVDPFDPKRMSFTELPGGDVIVHLGLTKREEVKRHSPEQNAKEARQGS